MAPRDVKPEEHADFFNESIRRLQSTYGCLLAVDDQNRSVAKGTAVFVSVGPLKTLVTARHVVRSPRLLGRNLRMLLSRLGDDGLAVVGEQTVPINIPLELEVLAESEALDIAFLRAPKVLAAMAEARFFDAMVQADAATGLRPRWRAHHSDTTSLPYFVMGFPNFGHLVGDAERPVETLSTTALPAYVTQFEDYPWDGRNAPAPQMLLEADAREESLVIGERSDLLEEISRRLFHPRPEEPEPLGGFSGGPVVVIGEDGEFLIGIIKEGTPLFGSHFRIAASCWDDCLAALSSAVAQQG